jgi:hypothetical protein
MNFDIKRLLDTDAGRILVSIVLGLGLATLFRKICTDGTCIDFHGVVVGDVESKVYRHDDKCYKYRPQTAKCNTAVKRVVDVHEPLAEALHNRTD